MTQAPKPALGISVISTPVFGMLLTQNSAPTSIRNYADSIFNQMHLGDLSTIKEIRANSIPSLQNSADSRSHIRISTSLLPTPAVVS